MSLGKLLATGRSLVGGSDAGRYQLSNHNRLPNFGSAKNPFAVAAMPTAVPALAVPLSLEVAQSVADVVEAVTPAEPVVAAAPLLVAELKKPRRIPKLALQQARFRFALKVRGWANTMLAFGCAAFAKLMLWLRKMGGRVRRSEPKSAIPRFGKPAMQTELSLDNVKVVRNDLHESDLEIVVVETVTSTQLAPTVSVATPHRGPVPAALKKITGRIIGAKIS